MHQYVHRADCGVSGLVEQSSPVRQEDGARSIRGIHLYVGVVLIFQWAVVGLAISPFVKFVLVSLLAVPTSFFVGYWVRKPLRL